MTKHPPLRDVTSVRVLARYIVELTFDQDPAPRVIDLEREIWGPAFAPLRDNYAEFLKVSIDYGTIVWADHELDMAPAFLYALSKPSRPRRPVVYE